MAVDNENLTKVELTPEIINAIANRILTEGSDKLIKAIGLACAKNIINIDPVYTVNEVAKMKGYKQKSTIINHIEAGLLKATKPGKSWEIKHSDLINYLDGKK